MKWTLKPKEIELTARAVNNLYGSGKLERLAKTCAEIQEMWTLKARKELAPLLVFNKHKFKQLRSIGRNRHMWKDDIKRHLPAPKIYNLRFFYEVSLLSADKIDLAIRKEVITPDNTKRESLSPYIGKKKQK